MRRTATAAVLRRWQWPVLSLLTWLLAIMAIQRVLRRDGVERRDAVANVPAVGISSSSRPPCSWHSRRFTGKVRGL